MKRFVALIAVLAFATPFASSQEKRLSEVAGGIRLQPEGGTGVLVDPAPRPTTDPQGSIGGQMLLELSELLLENATTVGGLLDEVRNNEGFYDLSWRRRMTEANTDLTSVSQSLLSLEPEPRYSDAFESIAEAARESIQAADAIDSSITNDQPLYGSAFEQVLTARKLATAGVDAIRTSWNTELDESEPAPENPQEVSRNIDSTCRSTASEGWAFSDCVAEQEAARVDLSVRFSSTVLVDDARFNTVRNQCRLEWPADYVARDRCERNRFRQYSTLETSR